MPRGQLVIEPWKNEAGVWAYLQLVTAIFPNATLPIEFFRAVVHSEMPSKKSKKALNQFFLNWYRETKPMDNAPWKFAELVDCAVKYYDCEPDCKEDLFNVFAAVERGKWDESFAQLRKALEKSKSKTTLKLINSVGRSSCYFDLASSEARPNSIADPFFSLRSTGYAWKAVEWIMKEVMGYPRFQTGFAGADTTESWKVLFCHFWEEIVLLDMLSQLAKPGNREAVWKKLEEMGIKLDGILKERIVYYLQGKTKRYEDCLLAEAARDSQGHWEFNREAFELARHQWTEKWADSFARKFNQSKEGIARFKWNSGTKLEWSANFGEKLYDTPAREVLEWIRFNTHYAPAHSKCKDRQRRNPHSYFMRILGEYCKASWLDDVHKELEEYSFSLRSSGNDQSQEDATKEFLEKIGSLGLSFSPAAMFAIKQNVQGSRRVLSFHKFEVDPRKVSKKNATYIKTALGKSAEDCKFCGTCACKPDDSCFYNGAGSGLACLESAIYKGIKSGMFFQKSSAFLIDDCGEKCARRLQTVCRQHKRSPLPALKLLRKMDGERKASH